MRINIREKHYFNARQSLSTIAMIMNSPIRGKDSLFIILKILILLNNTQLLIRIYSDKTENFLSIFR